MNCEKLAEDFWENGFLMFEDYFESSLMDEYNNLILEHFGMNPDFLHDEDFVSRSGAEVIPWFPQREGVLAFDKLEQHQELNELTQHILGDSWRSLYSMVMFSKQGTAGQAWHQDSPPETPEHFNMNRLVYTMDITNETGGQTVVVKGSHKKGVLPASDHDQSFANEIILSPKKGTLILLHGHIWHRVLPVTGKYRVSTNYRSVPKGTPDDVTDICVYRDMRYQFSTKKVLESRSVN